MWPQPDLRHRPVRALDGGRLEVRPSPEHGVAYGARLRSRERADGEHESTPGPQQVGDSRHDGHLQASKAREVLLLRTPQELRASPGGTQAGARSIHKDPVEGAPDGREYGVLGHDVDPDAEPVRKLRHQSRPAMRHVPGDGQASATDDAPDVAGLAARPGARVQDAFAGPRIERPDDERRRLVLDREPAVAPTRKPLGEGRVHEERVRIKRPTMDLQARPSELALELAQGDPAGVRPYGEWRRGGQSSRGLLGFRSELPPELPHQGSNLDLGVNSAPSYRLNDRGIFSGDGGN